MSARHRYQSVPHTDDEVHSSTRHVASNPSVATPSSTGPVPSLFPRLPGESEDAYQRRLSRQHISSIVHTLAWCGAALFILYHTDMIRVIMTDSRVNR